MRDREAEREKERAKKIMGERERLRSGERCYKTGYLNNGQIQINVTAQL